MKNNEIAFAPANAVESMSERGLVINPEITEKEWHALAKVGATNYERTGKAHFQATASFIDILNFGDTHFHDTYSDAIDVTREYIRQQVTALKRWMDTLKKVAPERRHPNLTLSHHDEVASLEPDLQDKYLQLAEDEGMTVSELRKRIREEQAPKKKKKKKADPEPEEGDDDAASIEQKLIDCSNWISAHHDELTEKMKEPMHKIYNTYRRRWIAGK